MTALPITPGQKKQISSFVTDALEGGLDNTRVTQAKRLWDLGYGRALGYESFEVYLATIPEIPASLLADDPELPLLTLDDPRVPRTARAKLAGVKYAEFGYNDQSHIPFDKRHETSKTPYWFRAHNGRPNRGRKPSECRAELTGNLLAGTVDVGLALFTQHKNVVKEGEHVMELPGSVPRDVRGYCACLYVWDGQPKLNSYGDGNANPHYGAVVFRRE